MILLQKSSLLVRPVISPCLTAGRVIKQFLAALRVVTAYQGSTSDQSRTLVQVKAAKKEKLKIHFGSGFSRRGQLKTVLIQRGED